MPVWPLDRFHRFRPSRKQTCQPSEWCCLKTQLAQLLDGGPAKQDLQKGWQISIESNISILNGSIDMGFVYKLYSYDIFWNKPPNDGWAGWEVIGNSQLRPRDKAQRPWATADHPGCTRLQALISNPNSIETVGNHPSQGVPGLSIRGHTDFFKVGQVHDFNLRIFVFRKLWSKTSQEQTANCCLPQTSRIWDVRYQFGEVIPFWERDYWMVFSWQDSRALGQNATYEPTSTYFLNHLPCTFLVFLILVHYVHCHLPSGRFPSVSSIKCACGPFSLSKPFESFESLKSLAHLIWQVKVASPAIGVKTHSMELWPVCTGDCYPFLA